jgi:hypothetical protein
MANFLFLSLACPAFRYNPFCFVFQLPEAKIPLGSLVIDAEDGQTPPNCKIFQNLLIGKILPGPWEIQETVSILLESWLTLEATPKMTPELRVYSNSFSPCSSDFRTKAKLWD